MSKEIITNKQGVMILTLFIMGSTLVIGTGGEAKKDAWLAILLSMIVSIPILSVYSRVLSLFPGKDAYEIFETVFGKIIGKIIAIIYIWYAFHLGALVLRNFGEFINIVAFPETPKIVPMIILGILCILAIKDGIELLGRWSELFLPAVLFLMLVVHLLLIPNYDVKNILPILYEGFTPILKGAFSAFSFPFGETIVFALILYCIQNKKSPYRVYLYALLVGGLLVIIIAIRNLLVLGQSTELYYFASYAAVSKVNIANFIQRIEGSVALVFIITCFVKISVCMLAACNGVSRVVGLRNYRTIVTPLTLLMIELSYFIYDNVMEMKNWAFKIYHHYAFPFQVILPIIIWISAEIWVIRNRKKSNN